MTPIRVPRNAVLRNVLLTEERKLEERILRSKDVASLPMGEGPVASRFKSQDQVVRSQSIRGEK